MSSYPTYEEWKRELESIDFDLEMSSYPTYEEWKLFQQLLLFIKIISGSYPTYEEWKPTLLSNVIVSIYGFLSYL